MKIGARMADEIKKRQQAIEKLVSSHAIEDQEALVDLLAKEHGIETNQTVVSRDLKALGIVKRMVKGALVYDLLKIDAQQELLRLAVKDVVHNETLIVVYTVEGMAAFVGDYLESRAAHILLGTIAGENMLFVAPKSIKNIKRIFIQVSQLLHIKKMEAS